ncbi:MAG: GNAT family N-acetyltransferase [Armatimonadota bacterium]|nr:MAG: GNAT family N-acetyltransferase [Armatimonadota bacterium]
MLALRKADACDCAAVAELATAIVGFDADRRACFDTTLASPDHDVIVAELDGAVIGYAHLMTYQDLTHGALAGELLGLVVREDLRRRGIARTLMGEIIRLARQRGIGEFHINTEEDNEAAKALYASLGAEVVGVQMEIDLE